MDGGAARAAHPELGEWLLRADPSAPLLFCENETNNERLFGVPNSSAHVKDAINEFVVGGDAGAVNPAGSGTKVAAHHVLEVGPGESASIRVRLTAALDTGRRAGCGLRSGAGGPPRRGRPVLRDGHPLDASSPTRRW